MVLWLQSRLAQLEAFAQEKLLPAILLFVFGLLTLRLILKLLSSGLRKTRLERTASKLIRSVLRTVLYVLLVLGLLSTLGIDVTGIVALASVLTLAVSLSLQNALTNLFGGFTLLYTKPFLTGDYAEIAGQSGTVTDIGLTYTTLTTPDNKVIFIPNNSVISAEIVNYTACPTRRLDISLRCDPAVPASAVTAVLLQAAQHPEVLPSPPPFAGVKEYRGSAIEYVLQVWVKTDQYWPAKYQINQTIHQLLQENGIAPARLSVQMYTDK